VIHSPAAFNETMIAASHISFVGERSEANLEALVGPMAMYHRWARDAVAGHVEGEAAAEPAEAGSDVEPTAEAEAHHSIPR
jgi:hypothetical protein